MKNRIMASPDSAEGSHRARNDLASSTTPAPKKAAANQRLAEALRANLGRRKAQQRERKRDAGPAGESRAPEGEAAGNGASADASGATKGLP